MAGLKEIHSLDYLHTDIRPENIVRDSADGRPFIVSFEMAVNVAGREGGVGEERGYWDTLFYMPFRHLAFHMEHGEEQNRFTIDLRQNISFAQRIHRRIH